MKIAVIHAGQPRTYARCINNWKLAVKDRYDADFYFGVWNESGLRTDPIPDNARQWVGHLLENNTFVAEVDRSIISKEEIIDTLSPLATPERIAYLNYTEHTPQIIEALINCGGIYSGGGHPHNASWMGINTTVWHQWFSVKAAWKLLEQSEIKYDLVIRTRMDTAWVGYPTFTTYENIQNPMVSEKDPHDYLVYGPMVPMKVMCGIYDVLPWIVQHRNGIDGAGIDGHTTMEWAFKHMIRAEDNQTNLMSMVRKHSYPEHPDVSFLLEEEHSRNWRNANINTRQEYRGI